jgi:hypothetical protein
MKRSWDVIRNLLIKIEEQPGPRFELYPKDFSPIDEECAAYHMLLLHKAGMIEGIPRDMMGAPLSFIATGMTWEGHELLDSIKSNNLWLKVREMARQKGLELSFDAIKLLTRVALEALVKG